LGHPCKFQWVWRLGSVTARHSSNGRKPNCGLEQRAPPIFGRAAITLGIGPHSSIDFVSYNVRHGHKDQDQYVVHPQLNENPYKFALVVVVILLDCFITVVKQ